jgi:hypothetical protein
MAWSSYPLCSSWPKIDEYARLQAENDEEAAHREREEALRQQRASGTEARAEFESQSRHFQRHFQAMMGHRAVTAKPHVNHDISQAQRNADFYGFYYGQL